MAGLVCSHKLWGLKSVVVLFSNPVFLKGERYVWISVYASWDPMRIVFALFTF